VRLDDHITEEYEASDLHQSLGHWAMRFAAEECSLSPMRSENAAGALAGAAFALRLGVKLHKDDY
jgi:hypothetical protein